MSDTGFYKSELIAQAKTIDSQQTEIERLIEKLEIEEEAYDMLATQHDVLQARVEVLEGELATAQRSLFAARVIIHERDTATEQRD